MIHTPNSWTFWSKIYVRVKVITITAIWITLRRFELFPNRKSIKRSHQAVQKVNIDSKDNSTCSGRHKSVTLCKAHVLVRTVSKNPQISAFQLTEYLASTSGRIISPLTAQKFCHVVGLQRMNIRKEAIHKWK